MLLRYTLRYVSLYMKERKRTLIFFLCTRQPMPIAQQRVACDLTYTFYRVLTVHPEFPLPLCKYYADVEHPEDCLSG